MMKKFIFSFLLALPSVLLGLFLLNISWILPGGSVVSYIAFASFIFIMLPSLGLGIWAEVRGKKVITILGILSTILLPSCLSLLFHQEILSLAEGIQSAHCTGIANTLERAHADSKNYPDILPLFSGDNSISRVLTTVPGLFDCNYKAEIGGKSFSLAIHQGLWMWQVYRPEKRMWESEVRK